MPGQSAAVARPNLRTHLRPSVRNDLLRDTLAGDDEDTGGSQDLAALCQAFLHGSGSPYRDPSPNVDVITRDGTTQAGSGAGCSTAQNETVVAVNPANPANLVAGANDYRLFNSREGRNDGSGVAYTSFDGGRTWRNVVLPGLTVMTGATGQLAIMDSAGDPAIAFGPGNRVYYANLVFSRLSTASAITVSASDDGGLTWGAPSIVRIDGVTASGAAADTPLFNDKEWIAVDQNSGAVYVTWSQFTFADPGQEDYLGSPIVISSSTDQGRTFSAVSGVGPGAGTIRSSITAFAQGSVPQVGRDGTVYVAWETAVCRRLACDRPTDHDATIVGTSKDGGRSFSLAEVGINYDFPTNPDTGRSTLTGEVFRVSSFPSLSYDATTDRLVVAWADDRNGRYDAQGRSLQTNGDVFWASSPNGAAWSPLHRLGTDQDEVFPWIAANGGRTAVSFYTRAYDPWDPSGRTGAARFGVGLDYALAQPTDTAITRLTTQTSDPRIQFTSVGAVTNNLLSGVFIGDYTGLAIGSDGVAHPVWTDFRGKPGSTKPNQDVYTQAVPLG